MYHDKRFQVDINFPFVAFSHAQMKTSTTQSFLLADQCCFGDIADRLLNVDQNVQLKNLLKVNILNLKQRQKNHASKLFMIWTMVQVKCMAQQLAKNI